jgi:hypothetical protein
MRERLAVGAPLPHQGDDTTWDSLNEDGESKIIFRFTETGVNKVTTVQSDEDHNYAKPLLQN